MLCSYTAVTLATAFALLEQATATTIITTTNIDTTTTTSGVTASGSIDDKPVTVPINTTSSDSNKVSQKRDSAEHVSPDPLTKDLPTTVPSKPEPKLRNLKPITNTQNKETDCSVSPDSTGNTSGSKDKMNTSQNVSKENCPAPHMHSEESTNVVGNDQSNSQYLANDTILYQILEVETFAKTFHTKSWWIIFWRMFEISQST